MALIQKTKKVTHCLAATKQYMHRFFATLTHMYETGLQTDLVLVASDGTSFSIHKVTTSMKLSLVFNFVQPALVRLLISESFPV